MEKNFLWECLSRIGTGKEKLYNLLIKISNSMNYISENYDSIIISLDDIKDRKKFNINIATMLLDRKIGLKDVFLSRNICVPIFYFLDQGTLGEAFKEVKYDLNSINVEELINSIEIKEYYLKQMNEWINEETNDYMRNFIEEIRFNFEKNNIYCTTLNLFTLIEYKINLVKKQNVHLIKKDKKGNELITATIKNILKENCFNYKKDSQLSEIYDKFLDNSSASYLYESTNENPKSITRHMLHGERLDLIDKNNMMSLIFFTDCIYKMLFIKQ